MKIERVFMALMICLLAGGVAAYAEPLQGMVVSIDSENSVLVITPAAGPEEPKADLRVSVLDFIKSNGPAQLNDLEIGKKVTLEVQKGANGTWELRSLNKPDISVPTTTKTDRYLKTTGAPENPPDSDHHAPSEQRSFQPPPDQETPAATLTS